ncbi:MAG TPA: TonB-dependent receptor [Pyrinomonadaceae bacterium]|nr:TonB-dependent receptor [Pyrinomonadaceae bacterium]
MMSASSRWFAASIRIGSLLAATILCASVALGQTQANAADLNGVVRDPTGAAVVNAAVKARNTATNFTRAAITNDEGYYQITNLPPGDYEVTVEADGFSRGRIPSVILTVGQRADLDIPLTVGSIDATVDISAAEVALVEPTNTTVANTIDQKRINELPINERSATGFALTLSTVGRDNGRPIGPAPTSGLNIGGQRGRSTLVQVDGADFTDNSINAARSTVSQEAVQEYQVATNSYAAEFGRATGGIVNVVTKSGTNDYHGNVFGFLRHKTIQARNAFAPVIDNDPDKKPPFTRVQYGATFGGPIVKDRTFFFTSFEQRRRQESGFFTSDVAAGLNGSITIGAPFLPFTNVYTGLTPAQATFIGGELARAATIADPVVRAQVVGTAITYATFASSGGQIGLNGVSSLRSPGGAIPAGQIIGGRFFITGAPVPSLANNGILPNFVTVNGDGQPIAFRPLNNLSRIFPISEASTYFSLRGDHQFNSKHNMILRFGYNPSDLTGIQDESQNQTLGQNDFSRTGIQTLKDLSFAATLNSSLSNSLFNEAKFNFGRRKATFDSQIPGAAIQVIGSAFMGSNPFSPVERTEKRYQFADNLNYVHGNHTFKFGGDINFIDIGARFELNFPGLHNFGGVARSTLASFIPGLPTNAPDITPVQSYGLGFPSAFIQGFGNPNSTIKNKPLAFFAQDSWKLRPNVTLNYGLRYDVELTDTIAPTPFTDPLTGISLSASDLLTAQDAVGVQQGFPRDTNNFAPRIGVAWDINNNGKTVLRAAYGLFYDHPLLAVAFNSDIADASQQQQYFNVLPGNPAPNQLLNLLQIFQGTVCSAASMNPLCATLPAGFTTPGVARTAEYLPGRVRFNDQTFVGFGPLFPFTLNVAKDFQYAYANQANLTIERQLTKNMSVSAGYIFVGAHHLPHPQDVNAPRPELLIENFRRFAFSNPVSNAQALFLPLPVACPAPPGTPACPPGYTVVIPGLVGRNALGQGVVSPIAANYFRPNAPNYFFVSSITNGAVTQAAFDAALVGANTLRTPGSITPFGDVSAQLSDGNSNYNALNVELKRRFANNFQFLASYTWSHSIDDSSDLQTLLKPQDNRNFAAERADSLFDQRHRFVFSGALSSPVDWRNSSSATTRFFSDFTIAPIIEISSGRPFNILTGTDSSGDLQSSNDRPSVAADGTLFVPTTPFTVGSLGRNSGIIHGYASFDLRVMRAIRFGERFSLDVIAEGFNLFNRFNEAAASPFFLDVNAFGQRAGNGRYYSKPTAAFDSRQFQFGLKLNF